MQRKRDECIVYVWSTKPMLILLPTMYLTLMFTTTALTSKCSATKSAIKRFLICVNSLMFQSVALIFKRFTTWPVPARVRPLIGVCNHVFL